MPTEEKQIEKQFDKKTLIKIGKGALIAGTGTVALYLLSWIRELDLGLITPLVVGLVPVFVNAIKEWMKGE